VWGTLENVKRRQLSSSNCYMEKSYKVTILICFIER